MSIDAFRDDPWVNSHPTYDQRTFFHIRPAPEFATGEVLVSSLYRACGLAMPEKEVSQMGREFVKDSYSQRVHAKSGSKLDIGTWRVVTGAVLESPKQPNQSSKRFLQMCPMVPDVALYSGSARLSPNSWNPGQLIQRMIAFGAPDDARAAAAWRSTFEALSVADDDDIWARWLQEEFGMRNKLGKWAQKPWLAAPSLPDADKSRLAYPSQQFVRDLDAIIQAKPYMTRRQWVSLLEALVRIGAVAHVLWLGEVNHRVWQALRLAFTTSDPLPDARTIVTRGASFVSYGKPAGPIIRDNASRYLIARLGINAVLWHLELLGSPIASVSSLADLDTFLATARNTAAKLQAANVDEMVLTLREGEKNARTIACKKGIGSNLVEFARYVLGQRQTADDMLRGYDQGYILRKKGDHRSAPFVVSLGPVAILALVHCCLRDAAGPRSIQKLCQHLGHYGIGISRDDVTASDLGRKLRTLGLVLDSPDAESGMLLMPPFDGVNRAKADFAQ